MFKQQEQVFNHNTNTAESVDYRVGDKNIGTLTA